jgi:hypothetical protein
MNIRAPWDRLSFTPELIRHIASTQHFGERDALWFEVHILPHYILQTLHTQTDRLTIAGIYRVI